MPEAFLVMLLIQFTTMVIDRALYLRKTVLGKLIFQVILVFSIHLWMFFILPAVTERYRSHRAAPRALRAPWVLPSCPQPHMVAPYGRGRAGVARGVTPPSRRLFSLNTVAQLWYFVKCIYFSLSAYQIRCGYPTRILGNFLTKKYNHLNLFLFQG